MSAIKSLYAMLAKIGEFEQLPEQTTRARCYQDLVGFRELLHSCRQVRRLTDDAALLHFTVADEIADHHQPGGDADARFE